MQKFFWFAFHLALIASAAEPLKTEAEIEKLKAALNETNYRFIADPNDGMNKNLLQRMQIMIDEADDQKQMELKSARVTLQKEYQERSKELGQNIKRLKAQLELLKDPKYDQTIQFLNEQLAAVDGYQELDAFVAITSAQKDKFKDGNIFLRLRRMNDRTVKFLTSAEAMSVYPHYSSAYGSFQGSGNVRVPQNWNLPKPSDKPVRFVRVRKPSHAPWYNW